MVNVLTALYSSFHLYHRIKKLQFYHSSALNNKMLRGFRAHLYFVHRQCRSKTDICWVDPWTHYINFIVSAVGSQITGVSIVYSRVCWPTKHSAITETSHDKLVIIWIRYIQPAFFRAELYYEWIGWNSLKSFIHLLESMCRKNLTCWIPFVLRAKCILLNSVYMGQVMELRLPVTWVCYQLIAKPGNRACRSSVTWPIYYNCNRTGSRIIVYKAWSFEVIRTQLFGVGIVMKTHAPK